MTYRMKDLKAVKTYFRGDRRFGRTTTLVHVPTGTALFEAMGVVPLGRLHIAFLDHQCKQNDLDLSESNDAARHMTP